MINILICDDDKSIVEEVSTIIEAWGKEHNVEFWIHKKYNGSFILEEKGRYDIAFIDIEMPGISGLELSEELQKNNPDILVLVITSYQNYIDDAMKIHVFRYLSKPIDHERLINNFRDAIAEYKENSKFIVIEQKNDVHYIATKDILYIENLKHGSKIHTKKQVFITARKPKEWLKIINQPQFFVPSHNSITVNLQNVARFDTQSVSLKKADGEIIKTYMSRRRYGFFKEAFLNFAGGVTDYDRFMLSVCLCFRTVGILYLLHKQVRKTLENRLYFNMLCSLFCCAVFT